MNFITRTTSTVPIKTLGRSAAPLIRLTSIRKTNAHLRRSSRYHSSFHLTPNEAHPIKSQRNPWIVGLVSSIALAAFSLHQYSTAQPIQNSTEDKLLKEEKVTRRSKEELRRVIEDEKLPMRERMPAYIEQLQSEIVEGLSSVDPSTKFRWDHWERASGGSGTSCILQEGAVFEKAGVNVSIVHGTLPPAAVRQMRHRLDEDRFGWWDGQQDLPFFACGISLVVHPLNPMAPTVHLNYRYFEVLDPAEKDQQSCLEPKVWWFGGGTDLTPSYLFQEDAQHFHQQLKTQCDKHNPRFYPDFKAWCDRYFFIPHRNERRGIGGIFFDDLSGNPLDLFNFIRDLGDHFLPSYLPIIERRQWMRFSDHHKRWQQLRRGRYVEFNLVYDRGTKFGLATPGARIESILMSLPLTSRWEYMSELGTEAESAEKELLEVLKEPKEWA
ncbi:coproporphyrinogen III oxidase [Puccinia graminis f. sp. tritici CRL 75-36-700-3]|uniref:coproporphyrinogen oxidase n=1 Tax=Puccinia graminis f. sp. tritici (strain CRL 75-36-700-3 / race SCCL) TaxID=418459 RepID=E3L9I1_PUCGT|nr:coproporphyrinogen III oxidase [Puccinia graminis f. sp. tritici CRL 75-36-700-3]EFP93206.2 coproporphyrinogen III oxidase [Puccinia graminis f. sp. tritici CRL 75-36-700-3]